MSRITALFGLRLDDGPTDGRFPYERPREQIISKMRVGEFAWTLPWALTIDEEGWGWVNSNYPADHTAPAGTAQLYIERREDGWHVDPATVPYEFRAKVGVGGGWHDLRILFTKGIQRQKGG